MPPKAQKRLMHAIAGVTETEDEVHIVASSTSLGQQSGDAVEPASLSELDPDELRYFELVKTGQITDLTTFLSSHPKLNKDCLNCQGYTSLHVAVRQKDLAMVKFLVQNGVRLKDALLHAVETGDVPLTEFLVTELSKTDAQCEKRGYASSATYTADVSPIILAAQMGHWTLIHFFIKRGNVVEAPHRASCLCKTCIKAMRIEGVNVSTRNLNTYKAICNPHYMLQVSGDPLLDSFLYVQSMAETSYAEEEFRRAYDEQIAKLRTFTCGLLDQCRTVEETRVLLERQAGLEGRVAHLAFPRVILALQYNEREFVTHCHVQQVLRLEWEGEFQAWNRLPFQVKLFHFVVRFFTLPFIAVWIKLKPESTTAKHWSSPVSKYMNHFAASILFVFFVYLQISLDKSRTSRGAPGTGVEWLIVIWVMGYVFEEIIHCYSIGASRYFRNLWHWYDITMLSVFILTFIFWIVAWAEMLGDPSEGTVPTRKDWPSTDSTLIHEALFAVSSVLSVFKLMFYFQESAKLGPLQVSITSMMVEIVRFLFICVCIMLAFAFGLTRMYEPYHGMKRKEPDGDEVKQNPAFTTFLNSMKTLFHRMLGVASEDQADVVVANADDGSINEHKFTEFVGSTMYSLYQVLMLVAMLNSLIAIVTGTFQKIIDNAEVHWKFYRTRLWMHYINEALVVPSPFLIFQIPLLIVDVVKKKNFWPPRPQPTVSYSDVINKVVQRYLCHERVILYD
ncbi:short transient receptor potential channel 4-like [Dermacentor albipictus]|uniref:short transient receptor potential channel 4-like n=1 Tax=Dermacentor albipictus TaxID=60249 RepID=UPI0031FDB3AF